jgi:RimJ/RimL family protein N-acetyltransferase
MNELSNSIPSNEGDKMELQQFSQEHFSVLASWFPTEADLIQWGGPKLRFPLDNSQMNAMLNEITGDQPDKFCWMALYENCLVGHAQLLFDWKNGNATLARVAIAPAFRGQKLAVPMLNLVIAQAFKYPQLMRLELNVFSFNQSAIQAYKRLGFVEEGRRRSSMAVGNERWDTIIMAILRSEYKLLNEKVAG